MPAAQQLCRVVAADPAAPVVCGVVGPGGAGKTGLLTMLARIYERAGVPVRRKVAPLPEIPPADVPGPILIDDAHELDTATLSQIRQVAEASGARLVFAYRPWPSPPELSALASRLGRVRAPVVLGYLDRAGVAARTAAVLGARPPGPLLDLICEQTAGLPALVDRLATVVRDGGGPEAVSAAALATVPTTVIEQFRYDLNGVDERVHELLLAVALDAPTDRQVLAPLLDLEAAEIDDVLHAARATGLLLDDGTLVPLAQQAILQLTPGERRRRMQQRFAESALDRGAPVLPAACLLLGAGVRGTRAAAVMEAAGDEALRESSPLAAQLFAEAVAAGAPASRLAARRAEAAALIGDFDTALRLADRVVADPTTPDQGRGLSVLAAVLAQRGMLAGSAELYRRGGMSALAVPALVGTGEVGEARSLLAVEDVSAPTTMLGSAASLTARGIYNTVAGSPTAALSELTRAASLLEPIASTALLPDTPSALAALVAVHCGELDVAQSVLRRAVSAGLGGRPAQARHRLLQAWILMLRGDVTAAREAMMRATPTPGRFEPRDELVAAGLEVGIARRLSDIGALRVAWGRAREAIVRHPVDLFVLQPLGEFAIAAARLREPGWIRPYWAEAETLLDRLGRPLLWTVSVHWYGLGAAIVAERIPEAERHCAALQEAAESSTFAATLSTAARTWLHCLAGDIDAAAVEAAARGLHALGWTWDGARLAGEAAIRTKDRKAIVGLLACARALQGTASVQSGPELAASAAEPAPPGDSRDITLSEREREVAVLVLAGLTHKQIGERLFISAKTVEHHVARMRQRLGSGSRGELFARLRVLIRDSARSR